jgi:hypothetical protein
MKLFGNQATQWAAVTIFHHAEQLKPLSEKDFALCPIEQGKI